MNIFLDANVIIAVLNREYPLYTHAAQVLSLADRPGYRLFVSPLTLAIAYYFSSKKSGKKVAQQKIASLLSHVSIAGMNGERIQQALLQTKASDIEDAMQDQAAADAKCSHIVTEDVEDFYFSQRKILRCRELLVEVQSRRPD